MAASPALIAWCAFALGLSFGALASATRFCTLGAVADLVAMGDGSRMRMWLLAIALALLGAQALHGAGLIDLSKTLYTASPVRLASHIVGGLMFGLGMPLASGCGAKMLVRLGGGNLKSLVVLVFFGVSGYMALRGVFGVVRAGVLDPVVWALPVPQDLPSLLSAATGMASGPLRGAVTFGVAALLLLAVFRRGVPHGAVLAGGTGVGACVVAGWWVSGYLGYLPEDPNTLQEAFLASQSGRMESLSFSAPVAYLLELLMLWSDETRIVTFGIAASLGVVVGSLLHAVATNRFRIESFVSTEDLVRHLLGAVLMGAGGVTALGCTIGQGVTGVSTLAVGSWLTLGAILVGAWAMLKFDEWRLARAA